jgi:hypothetical protein
VGSADLSVERDYPEAWIRRRFRRRIALRLLLIGVLLAAAGIVAEVRNLPWAPICIGMAFPVLFMANLMWVWSLFLRCPRCGNQFGMPARQGGSRPGFQSQNPFTKRCMNCGLALRARH